MDNPSKAEPAGDTPAPSGSLDVTRPLDEDEEAVWRAMARMMIVLPRVLEGELRQADGLMPSEYTVLMNLSEQPGRSMRMSELAHVGTLSGSGMTRVVERLARSGLVERVSCQDDARVQLAVLTDKGFARLEAAYPDHLRSVRSHVIDHLAGLDLVALAKVFATIAGNGPGPSPRRSPRL